MDFRWIYATIPRDACVRCVLKRRFSSEGIFARRRVGAREGMIVELKWINFVILDVSFGNFADYQCLVRMEDIFS